MPARWMRTSASSGAGTGAGRSEARRSRAPSQRRPRTRGRYTRPVRLSCRVGKGGTAGLAGAMMQFDLTPEQKQLKDTARRFAADDIVRKAWELGLMNFAVPEELGGPGLGALDTCLVLEELNYGCAGITNS